MILNTEQLGQKARELALRHDVRMSRRPSKKIWRQFEADMESLRDYTKTLHDCRASCSQPAEDWLLDHADFLEEQALVVQHQLSADFLNNLPRLRKSFELRTQSICTDYLEHADGILDLNSFISYLTAYQEVSVLSMAEAWALPLICRMALIRRLALVMEQVRERREICTQVERLLSRLEPANVNQEALKAVLDEAGEDIPLSGSLIVHLVSHLREWTYDSAGVHEWLLCKLENGPESLDRMVTYEHQLQAADQVTAGSLIGSLRLLSRLDWRSPFEQICLVERTLRQESAGDYPRLDFSSRDVIRRRVEKLARRMHVPENLVAQQAVELGAQQYQRVQADANRSAHAVLPRSVHAAYYLLDQTGIRELRQALTACSRPRKLMGQGVLRRATGAYFSLLAGLFVFALLTFAAWVAGGVRYSIGEWIAILAALLFPASEWAITLLHGLIQRTLPATPLLRLDFSRGVPPEAATMVVIPVIWSTPEEVQQMVERLELHYLANRDPNIHFALLGDFADAPVRGLPEDEQLIKAASEGIAALNSAYSEEGGSTFHLFHRHRLWNPSEEAWMGWERKRGKLVEFVEFLKGGTDTSFDVTVGDASVLPSIQYIITLDADTQIPMGDAQRMIGTLHLSYNRPRLNRTGTRVVEGYGVLQPRIGISHEAASRSRLASLWAGEPGIDPYAFAVSDPYQDAFGEAIFTGKGIFDVNTFAEVLCERIPDNRVLSHDLLEGGFLRAGLFSDIELIDDHPATFSAFQGRMHRWVRGDWQLFCWLFPRVCDRRGTLLPVDLSVLTRWQIIDNLRRSLLTPALYAILALGLTVLPGSPVRWLWLALATLGLPVIRQLTLLRKTAHRPLAVLVSAGQAVVSFITLPFQSALLLNAIGKSLYRLYVSKRHLLEWISFAEMERRNRGGRRQHMQSLSGGYVLIVLMAVLAVTRSTPALYGTGLAVSAIWALAPLGVLWLDRSRPLPAEPLSAREQEELRGLASQIWAYYEDHAASQDHWLPPDNVQIDPPVGAAHRTSPTNIGLLLACALAARDFGFIDTPQLIERLEKTLQTVERMEKWNGHLYNWYDTVSLSPLPPLYVSTVDSGNFVSYLIVVKEGLANWLAADFPDYKEPEPTLDKAKELAPEQMNVAFSVELLPRVQEEESDHAHPPDAAAGGDLRSRGRALLELLEKLTKETDFRPLYDHDSKLFTLGYHVNTGQRETILYDLLASEARQASFVAIALGQVSVAHWFALGRTMTRIGKHPTLISWSGTMFEYLMPSLIMRTYRNTVWDSTTRGVVKRQIEYAHQRGVPYGISESGYYAFDFQMNYQYRAFGVPGLGFKRGLEQELVIAPYATIMTMPFAAREALQNLHELEKLGARGQYGFYEAIDCTQERMPEGDKHKVVRSFMAHHQGMSLLSLANLLLPEKMYDRFHQDKRVQAAELLLQERMPARPKVIAHPASARVREPEQHPQQSAALREFLDASTRVPEVCVLSNGTFTTMVTGTGSGFSRCKGVAISRWREDPIADQWGSYFYIRDVTRGKLWSPTFQPVRTQTTEQRAQFSLERASFLREEEGMSSTLEICVSPETDAEVRRLTLTNSGEEARILEVTTFVEVALAPPEADDAHPAFSKLFIQTEYASDPECLLARRRPRSPEEKPLWAVHSLVVCCEPLGPVEFETDRACFIGRGHSLAQPQGMDSKLSGKTGAVLDPAFIMRRRLTLQPGQSVQLFAITGMADTRDEAIGMVRRLSGEQQVQRTFQLAWTRSQIELSHLHLTAQEAMDFQTLASRALYAAPLREGRANEIAANVKGQSSLWAHGISGDLPIVLVRISDTANLPFVVKLLRGHEYLRRRGVVLDLVILNETPGGYAQQLQEAVKRAVEQGVHREAGQRGGVFPIAADQVTPEDRTLLGAIARVELHADGPSLKAQLRVADKDASLPPALKADAQQHDALPAAADATDELPNLLFFNGYGGFSQDGREYRMMLKNGSHLPAPWVNVMANPRFGCVISELGTGYTWWRNSREFKLTPWRNDPVLDPPGEVCYLRDEHTGDYWSATPAPARSASPYTVVHGRGYTRFAHTSHGLRQEMTVFVPVDDPVKVIELRIQNQTSEPRRLSVTYFNEWVLGVQRETNASFVVSDWDAPSAALIARNTYQETFRDARSFLSFRSDQAIGDGELSWTADRGEFLGRNGSLRHPAALGRAQLSGKSGPQHDACGAVQLRLTIEPNAERKIYVLLGSEQSHEACEQLLQKYSQISRCEQEFTRTQAFWDQVLGQTQVATPMKEIDLLLNGWLLYQTLSCRMWARTAFYQAGGAYGFRDQLQDSLALLHTRPDLVRAQILLHAAHQYEEGDVQHWWHEETQRGIRTRYSDDLLWLPYAAARYIEQTGDIRLLDEQASFLHSDPLGDDEHERYEPTVESAQTGTVFEHCQRAIDHALRFGAHGLPLMGIGDWNDGMNRVGDEGRGESVWLGWFLCDVLNRFVDLCERRDRGDLAADYRSTREKLAAALNESAWDEQWYRRAVTDDGHWLGSIHNDECRIDAIAQSWSVISGAAPKNKALQAMDSFDRELVDRDLFLARLLTPPFDHTDPTPGYIQGYPPGVRENGGQYTHGVIWSIIAWSKLGEGDKAADLFNLLNPIRHAQTPGEVREYTGEPYVMVADIYTADPHKGRAGWTWYTGAAGWMYQAGMEWLLGLQRRQDRLYIQPCIPRDWPDFSVSYRFGRTRYQINVNNPMHKSTGATSLSVNGKEVDLTQLASDGDGPFVELVDDGQEHQVVLTL